MINNKQNNGTNLDMMPAELVKYVYEYKKTKAFSTKELHEKIFIDMLNSITRWIEMHKRAHSEDENNFEQVLEVLEMIA